MSDIDTLRFEEAFARLEETLEELRSEGLALDRALALYEQGTRLAAHCDTLLADAELRVMTLTPADERDERAERGERAPRTVREEMSVYIEGEW